MKNAVVAAVLVGALAIVHAQNPNAVSMPAGQDFRFEVASVKQNKSGARSDSLSPEPGGRVTVTNMPARELILFAYQLRPFELVGGPSWLTGERFDIIAKIEGNPDWGGPASGRPDPIAIAMRTLLAERFKLKLHTETRQLDAYALLLVKPGVTGPKLTPSPSDCAAMLRDAQEGKLPPSPRPTSFDRPAPCGIRGRTGAIAFDGFPMTQAAGVFADRSGRAVVDRTGLTGNWQFVLTFSQERPIATSPDDNVPAPDPNAPSFFTALQEQLGLKLESTKAPVDVTVIDAVERPTDD